MKKILLTTLILLAFPLVTMAALTPVSWIRDTVAGFVRPGIITDTIRIPSLTNCNTIDTDADGDFACGTDGGGAPTDADYLVGTSNGSLSAEIVVGTSPGGELGGTWGSPTLDDSVTTNGWVMGTFTGTQLTVGTLITDLIDAVGAVDIDYGSADITDHTFTTDGTGTAEIVLPAGSIDSTEILNATILAEDLKAVDSPGDEECLTKEDTTGDFEWQSCGAGGSTTFDAIGDPTTDGSIDFTSFVSIFQTALNGGDFFSLTSSVADLTSPTVLLALNMRDDGDADGIFLDFTDDVSGTPNSVFSVGADGNLNSDGTGTFGSTVSTPTLTLTGTGTLNGLDAVDSTTESTIESIIDTLANLTSIQGKTFTLGGDFITSGASSITLTSTGTTNVTLPTTGTLATLAGSETLTNKTIAAASNVLDSCLAVAVTDEYSNLVAGTGKVTFRMPYAMTLTSVRGSLNTVATGGTLVTVDINEAGTTVISTKLTFDASEKTTTTAATPAVISDSALADDAEMTVDIDAVGNTTPGNGLKISLCGTI